MFSFKLVEKYRVIFIRESDETESGKADRKKVTDSCQKDKSLETKTQYFGGELESFCISSLKKQE